jgi:hypothetical protein
LEHVGVYERAEIFAVVIDGETLWFYFTSVLFSEVRMKTTWMSGDIIDVVQVRARVRDPEADLYQSSRSWVLVMNGESLQDGQNWNDDTIAFVCVEAIREKPYITAWERRARRVFFVRRDRVKDAGFQEGPVLGSDRYRLRDISADPEIAADGHEV